MHPIRPANILSAALAAGLLLLCGCGGAQRAPRSAPRASVPGPVPRARPVPPAREAVVTVRLTRGGRRVPRGFAGLSFETSELPRVATFARRGNLVALLRALPGGVLRFGGVTTDEQAAWVDGARSAPGWARTAVRSRDLRGLAALARASGWRVILTLPLGHLDPAAGADEARVAQRVLGRSLAAIEIGNEPDVLARKRLRPAGYVLGDFLREAALYRRALAGAAPRVRLIGPGVSSGTGPLPWIGAFSRALHPDLLSDHYYPSTACAHTATAAELLSAQLRRSEDRMLAALDAISAAARRPLLLDETNNVSCHGAPGVSDTFASALWAVDYGLRALRSSVGGLNFHDLVAEPRSYAPLVATSGAGLRAGSLHANPEWYALLLLGRLAGGRRVFAASTRRGLEAAAFVRPHGGLQVVLVDLDRHGSLPLSIRLRVPGRLRSGVVLRLRAPTVAARHGVTLGGGTVGRDGALRTPAPLPALTPVGRGRFAVTMTPLSAALVSLSP